MGHLREHKSRFQLILGCTDDMDASIDISKLSLGDLDRCRRFVLYHKTAFIAHYPPLDQDNQATFEGMDGNIVVTLLISLQLHL